MLAGLGRSECEYQPLGPNEFIIPEFITLTVQETLAEAMNQSPQHHKKIWESYLYPLGPVQALYQCIVKGKKGSLLKHLCFLPTFTRVARPQPHIYSPPSKAIRPPTERRVFFDGSMMVINTPDLDPSKNG